MICFFDAFIAPHSTRSLSGRWNNFLDDLMRFSNAFRVCEHHERVGCEERIGLRPPHENSCCRCSIVKEMMEKHQQVIWEGIPPDRWLPDGVWRDLCIGFEVRWWNDLMVSFDHWSKLITADQSWSKLTMTDDLLLLCVHRATFDEKVVWQVK